MDNLNLVIVEQYLDYGEFQFDNPGVVPGLGVEFDTGYFELENRGAILG